MLFRSGGPRISDRAHFGIPDPAWMERVLGLLGRGAFEELVEQADDAQLQRAGNAGGELLDWIVMLGMTDPPATGLVGRLAHPDANVTGITYTPADLAPSPSTSFANSVPASAEPHCSTIPTSGPLRSDISD